jgi:ATP-dependent Clp protease ATP-binding subunit ClpC
MKDDTLETSLAPAVVIRDVAYVWNERVDHVSLSIKQIRDRVHMAINLFVLSVGMVALLTFGIQQIVFAEVTRLFTSAFWLTPTPEIALMFFAFLCTFFIAYRLTESTWARATIPPRAYGQPLPDMTKVPAGMKQVNMARLFEATAMNAVKEAYQLAERFEHPEVLPLHIFIGCLTDEKAGVVFGRLGIRFDAVQSAIGRKLGELPRGGGTHIGAAATELFLASFVSAYRQGRSHVSVLEMFDEAYRRDAYIRELLYAKEIDESRFGNVVQWVRIHDELRERYERSRRAALHKPVGAMNRAMTSVPTPVLDQVALDLTADAVYGRLPLLVGRDQEMESLFRVIEGGGQSVVLVGSPGVGKNAVLAGIAELMVEENVPKILQDKRLVALSIPTLVSGAGPAEAQERLMIVLAEIAHARNIVLAIPNIEQMTGLSSGGEASVDLTAVLAEALEHGVTFVIATTSPDAFAAAVEPSRLGGVFQKVDMREPDVNTAIQILESKVASMENQHGVIFSFDALEKCVTLSDRYVHETYLPEKAIELAKETALDARKNKGLHTLVTGEDVARVLSEKTNIPITKVGEQERDTLLHLEERMHERVIGQGEAVNAVASALRRARTELRSQNRPMANFLFLGPTGVGKTELAKTVAETYFGDEHTMLRFDMSEYQDTSSMHRLIGVPGAKEGGLLTEAVRRQPFAIVLLDELEKAHPDILNLFLQVMDDGRLTDSAGRTIDFTNTIIVATSNASSAYVSQAVASGTPLEEIKTRLLEEELRGVFRPELLNRFDGVIVFKPLTMDEVVQIAYLLMGAIASRLEAKGIHFRAEDAAVEELARKGFDPKFGARPLRRVIQEQVENTMAEALLEGKARRRDTMVLKAGGTIDVEKAQAL